MQYLNFCVFATGVLGEYVEFDPDIFTSQRWNAVISSQEDAAVRDAVIKCDPINISSQDDLAVKNAVNKSDVINVSSQEDAPVKVAVNRSIAHLKSKLSDILDKTPHGKRKAVFGLGNDSSGGDDFVVATTRSGKAYSPAKKRKDPAMNSGDITTTKRPTKRPAKWVWSC